MGPLPKHSTFLDQSHVMRDRSHLYGTGTTITGSLPLWNFHKWFVSAFEFFIEASLLRFVNFMILLILTKRNQIKWNYKMNIIITNPMRQAVLLIKEIPQCKLPNDTGCIQWWSTEIKVYRNLPKHWLKLPKNFPPKTKTKM